MIVMIFIHSSTGGTKCVCAEISVLFLLSVILSSQCDPKRQMLCSLLYCPLCSTEETT